MIYTMGEVAEMFDVAPSLIRYWESQFDEVKPKRNNKGNRLFSPTDVETLKVIYHLVRERGMTLEGVKQALKASRLSGAVQGEMFDPSEGEPTTTIYERDMQIVERLQRLRSMVDQMRTVVEGERPQPRRRRDSSENQPETGELFAFYEQRLF